MKNLNVIPFWNNKHKFHTAKFSEVYRQRYVVHFNDNAKPLDSTETIEAMLRVTTGIMNDNQCLRAMLKEPQKKFLELLDQQVSKGNTIDNLSSEEINKIWAELEEHNNLTFITSSARTLAENKIGRRFFNFTFISLYMDEIADEKLLEYLRNDLHLLQSPFVIEYIKFLRKQKIKSKFLNELTKIICPKFPKTSYRKKPDERILDWIFVQIHFDIYINNSGKSVHQLSKEIAKEAEAITGYKLGYRAISDYYKEKCRKYIPPVEDCSELTQIDIARMPSFYEKVRTLIKECVEQN